MPHFRFAYRIGGFVLAGIGVIRMNLDGKLIGREKKFHQKREFAEWASRCEIGAMPFGRHFLPCLIEGAFKRARFDLAFRSGEPGFTGGFRKIGFVGVDRRERMRAPDAGHKFRLDARGFGPHGLSGGFSAREKAAQAAQSFVDALDGSGVRKPEIAGRAEGFSWDDGDLNFIEQELGNFCARFGESDYFQ